MAGVPSTTLEGWAVPMATPPWDHTYAISHCGLRWRCWGRSTGGKSICSGIGSSVVADCLSQRNSRARILYMITGVCHQTANRILHPAGVTVALASGYSVSVFRFGVYGLDGWPERFPCYAPPGGTPVNPSAGGGGTGSDPVGDGKLGSRLVTYNRMVVTMANEDEEKRRLDELSALVLLGLGRELDHPTFNQLANIQLYMRRTQKELRQALDAHQITPEAYLVKTNEALRVAMLISEKLLGKERFDAIFGEAGRHPEGLADRDAFFESQRPLRSQ
jgi:hypothetical protein